MLRVVSALDVAWTDRAALAKAWRESEAGAERPRSYAAAAVFGAAGDSRYCGVERPTGGNKGGRSTRTCSARPAISEIAALSRDRPVVLSLSPESEPLPWEWMLIEGTPLAERNPIVRAAVGVSMVARTRVRGRTAAGARDRRPRLRHKGFKGMEP